MELSTSHAGDASHDQIKYITLMDTHITEDYL
jgi:hypothetical protein